jgi:c-di-GMP-binding flagellar brake protein YcgR
MEKTQQLLHISLRESYRVLLSVKIDGSSKDRSFFCKSENISASGLLLETDKPLAKGDRLVCSFFLPESHRITVTGEVVRVIPPDGDAKTNRYGVKFFQVPFKDKEAIESFVDKKSQMHRSA